MRAIDRALEREAPPPFHTLRAMLAAELRDRPAANAAPEAARGLWPAPRRMSDWILGWYGTWAREAGDDEAVRAAERERRRRARDTEGPGDLGELPAAADGDR